MSVSELEQVQHAQSERRMAITIDFEEIVKCDSTNRDIIKLPCEACVDNDYDSCKVRQASKARIVI